MKFNIYLKACLYSLIPPFTDWVTQFVKRGMYLIPEIFNSFFAQNFWSCNQNISIPFSRSHSPFYR